MTKDDEQKKEPVTITIDGESFTVPDHHEEAASLLRLAGADPAQYDLAEVRDNGQFKVYRDAQKVDLKDGDRFVTVRQSAQVA